MKEMKPFRPLGECGHPLDCRWFYKDQDDKIHAFCIPCMAEILQKQGLKIKNYKSEEDFIREMGGK